MRRERRFQLVLFGLAVSLPVHIAIMIWLANSRFDRGGGGAPEPAVVVLAAFDDQELTREPDQTPFEDLRTTSVEAAQSLDASPGIVEATPNVASLDVGTAGSLSTPGGGGMGSGDGLGGGSGGTSFFGIGSRGVRFAYIVDTSGSMEAQGRMTIAMRELVRSIEALPDFAFFHVVLFSSGAYRPPWQDGWLRARPADVVRMRRWLSERYPAGGTYPLPAFEQVFALDVQPDVIYFMTDGEIPAETPEQVARLNARGRKVVINTIAFGDEVGRAPLERIARDSGGLFRFVDLSGGP
ncbi:MAG TPA: hypothetical protein PKC43_06730 [Phycisphaerales bacterium]|nr:hypothetical protein [Phycisphaerales bacterium]HMP37127.1 hypothetical protein [Phycisphaerales bacterium]